MMWFVEPLSGFNNYVTMHLIIILFMLMCFICFNFNTFWNNLFNLICCVFADFRFVATIATSGSFLGAIVVVRNNHCKNNYFKKMVARKHYFKNNGSKKQLIQETTVARKHCYKKQW